jgi:hypothetical protein
MTTREMKFLFEGIIFSSEIIVSRVSGRVNRHEFTINFFNRYLILSYRKCYCFIWENNRFFPADAKNEGERELIKTVQETITETLLSRENEAYSWNDCLSSIAAQ